MIINAKKIAFCFGLFSLVSLATTTMAVTLDPSFGTSGVVSTPLGTSGSASRVAVQPDGRIVAAGTSQNGSFTLVRYTTKGALDTTFNGTGISTASPGSMCGGQARALSLQPDGKIVVVGYSCQDPNHYWIRNFTINRYNADGSLDTTFGSFGTATVSFNDGASDAYAVVVQGTSIWVGGYAGSNMALAKLTSSGALDRSFGDGTGVVTTAVGASSAFATSLAIQADGKPVLAGHTQSNGTVFALTRYTTSGALDTTFGNGGKVITNVGGYSFGNAALATALAIQSDGKIVAAGYAKTSSAANYQFAVARYTSSGTLDSTFGAGSGIALTSIGNGDAIGNDVAIDASGGIIIGGYSMSGTTRELTLSRFDSVGNQDYHFGPVSTPVGSTAAIQGMALQSNGSIIVVGYGLSPATFIAARYH